MGYVKKAVSISVITCILAPNVLNADMSNFIQNNLGTSMTSESAGYYKSQVSGFLSGGSTRVRWGGGDNIRPFHLQHLVLMWVVVVLIWYLGVFLI